LLAALQAENEVVGGHNNEFRKDRQNLGDADIYEISHKKAGEMK
jgi:hypothetical protein